MNFLKGCLILVAAVLHTANAEVIFDETRQRNIPVEITVPKDSKQCTREEKCPVAFLSAGYGVSHTKYSFLATTLNDAGYLVIAVRHELPSDPPLSVSGNLFETRSENWQRGAETLDFLQGVLGDEYESYDFDNLLLVGHSNGGDISAWLASLDKHYIDSIITLDHRRVPLPRIANIKVLSIRASDFPADPGVLPSASEQVHLESCIVTIPNAKHNDISDFGPIWLKEKIQVLVGLFLNDKHCPDLKATLH